MRNYPKSKGWQDFKGKNKEERREAGYDVDKNSNE